MHCREYSDESVAISINAFFQKALLITIKYMQSWAQSVASGEGYGTTFLPIPEKLQMVVKKILNEEGAPFYGKFDGRTDRERIVLLDNEDEVFFHSIPPRISLFFTMKD